MCVSARARAGMLGCQREISVHTLLIAVCGASALFIKTQFQAALSPGLMKSGPEADLRCGGAHGPSRRLAVNWRQLSVCRRG